MASTDLELLVLVRCYFQFSYKYDKNLKKIINKTIMCFFLKHEIVFVMSILS